MLIEGARTAGGDCEELTAHLVAKLRELPASEIVAFQQLLAESFRYRLWGAAVLINAGCSDDGFEDFRGWLMAQAGRCTRRRSKIRLTGTAPTSPQRRLDSWMGARSAWHRRWAGHARHPEFERPSTPATTRPGVHP